MNSVNNKDSPKDSSDTRQISFMVSHADSEFVDTKLDILQAYDPEFYVRIIGIGDFNYMYKITCKQYNMEHDEYKKFMFQMSLRFGDKVKIR